MNEKIKYLGEESFDELIKQLDDTLDRGFAGKVDEDTFRRYRESLAKAHSRMYSDMETVAAMIDGTYPGVDLTEKFAAEIAEDHAGDPWAWIQARIKAGAFDGIHTRDYIPFTTTNSYSLKAQVAGINTYKGYGDTAVGPHIDFITEEIYPELHMMNKVNFNNGILSSGGTAIEFPWLASDLYHWLNSKKGEVPGGTAAGGAPTPVDYTETGVYDKLPAELQAVIVEKRLMLPKRYSADGVLTADNGWGWADAGKLWIPSETEVVGAVVWGDVGYGLGGFVQYPIFANNMSRAKRHNGNRRHWWLLSARSGDSTYFACVNYYGYMAGLAAMPSASVGVPVCFRIA